MQPRIQNENMKTDAFSRIDPVVQIITINSTNFSVAILPTGLNYTEGDFLWQWNWFLIDFYLITVRKRSCEKVMFSQACVKNSVHRGEVYTP